MEWSLPGPRKRSGTTKKKKKKSSVNLRHVTQGTAERGEERNRKEFLKSAEYYHRIKWLGPQGAAQHGGFKALFDQPVLGSNPVIKF